MRRFHGVELSDLGWFPSVMREAGNAYLRFAGELAGHPARIGRIIESALERSREPEILDLCSGGTGPVLQIARELAARGLEVPVTLTDLYPSAGGRQLIAQSGLANARYEAEALDAAAVPSECPGLRTILSAFHHFDPDKARQVLASAVEARRSIAIVEVAPRRLVPALMIMGVPLAALLAVPFLRPFRAAWLPLTYIIPVIPLFMLWDGLVSCMRAYTPDEILALARAADPNAWFDWTVEEPMMTWPVRGVSMVGIPRERLDSLPPTSPG